MKTLTLLLNTAISLILINNKFSSVQGEYPVAINEIVLTAETYIEEGSCDIKNPLTYPLVAGYLTSGRGQFSVSYGNNGFFFGDATGGIFVTITEDEALFASSLEVGTYVSVRGGTTKCLYGTLALDGGTIEIHADTSKAKISQEDRELGAYSPIQIGQFEKPPEIPNYEGINNNVCNCLDPQSYAKGRLITVRGTMVGGLFDDSPWGWKVFLQGSEVGDIGQLFIDAASDDYVPEIRDTLLVEGTMLCATGLVAQFAGVGWELLPRDVEDIWAC